MPFKRMGSRRSKREQEERPRNERVAGRSSRASPVASSARTRRAPTPPRPSAAKSNRDDDSLDEFLARDRAREVEEESQSSSDGSTTSSSYDDEQGSTTTYEEGDTTMTEMEQQTGIVDIIQRAFSRESASDNEEGNLTDNGSSVSDDDEESTESSSLNKVCYQLATNDGTLTELKVCLPTIGSLTKDIAMHLPSNSRVSKISLIFDSSADEKLRQVQERNLKVLCPAIAKNGYITHISLSNACINRSLALMIGRTLALNKSVFSISLKSCIFSESGLSVLLIGLQHHSALLQELVIDSSDLSSTLNADVTASSLPLLKPKSLSLTNTKISADGISFLCDCIELTPELTKLDLSQTTLSTESIRRITDCLKSDHQKLEELNLSACRIDDVDLAKLAKGLWQNPSLNKLLLSRNEFGDPGAIALTKMLTKNHNIVSLDVSKCRRISHKRSKEMADALRYNNSFLKSIFSASTSLAILESVDMIEDFGSKASKSAARVVSPK